MNINQNYDPITLNHWLWFKYRCHEGSAEDFQKLFENIMKRIKPEFMQIRPYGNIGDRKCDGLLEADSTIFQVYSPDELKQSELQKKINEDLDGAIKHWGENLKKWVFVYNVRRGLPPDIPKILSEKKTKYPEIDIESISSDELWEMARKLTLQQRAEVLGAPNGYEHLFLYTQFASDDIRSTLDKVWFILIQDILSPIDLNEVINALKPDNPFGAPIFIRPNIDQFPWIEAAQYQQLIVDNILAKSKDISLARFAVFSLAPIPLAVHLGFLLSDRIDLRCFHFNREHRSWQWASVEESQIDYDIQFTGLPVDLIEEDIEVVIRVSLSAKVSERDTKAVVSNKSIEIDIFVKKPDVMWLQSYKQLQKLAQVFRNVLTCVRDKVPECNLIHLFYAGSTGGAIVIGQQINPRMNPPVAVYEYSRQNKPRYKKALTLKETN